MAQRKWKENPQEKIFASHIPNSEVAQSCPTLCDPMDCSLQGSSIHGIFQARVLEWVTISFSRGFSRPRDRTWVSRIADRHFTIWATREASHISNKRLSTTNWHLSRALPMSEQQRHLPSASKKIEPHAVDLQQSLREFKAGWGTLCYREPGGQVFRYWMFLGTNFMISTLASHIWRSAISLHGDIRSSWLTKNLL